MMASARGVSSKSLLHVMTDLIVSAGENAQEYSMSQSTIIRARKSAIAKAAASYEDNIKSLASKSDFPIFQSLGRIRCEIFGPEIFVIEVLKH